MSSQKLPFCIVFINVQWILIKEKLITGAIIWGGETNGNSPAVAEKQNFSQCKVIDVIFILQCSVSLLFSYAIACVTEIKT